MHSCHSPKYKNCNFLPLKTFCQLQCKISKLPIKIQFYKHHINHMKPLVLGLWLNICWIREKIQKSLIRATDSNQGSVRQGNWDLTLQHANLWNGISTLLYQFRYFIHTTLGAKRFSKSTYSNSFETKCELTSYF